MIHLNYRSTNSGFCRAYYYSIKTKALFCLQLAGGTPPSYALFVCTADGEPSHLVDIEHYYFIDSPTGGTGTDQEIKEFLLARPLT